jgi:hypothetical protein
MKSLSNGMKRPSSKPLWIAVALVYGIFAILITYGVWRGVTLP